MCIKRVSYVNIPTFAFANAFKHLARADTLPCICMFALCNLMLFCATVYCTAHRKTFYHQQSFQNIMKSSYICFVHRTKTADNIFSTNIYECAYLLFCLPCLTITHTKMGALGATQGSISCLRRVQHADWSKPRICPSAI